MRYRIKVRLGESWYYLCLEEVNWVWSTSRDRAFATGSLDLVHGLLGAVDAPYSAVNEQWAIETESFRDGSVADVYL